MNKYQQPCLADWSTAESKPKRIGRIASAIVIVAVASFMMTHGGMESAAKTSEINDFKYSPPALTSEQEEYRNFFAKHGSPAPVEMARAVTATRRPALMSAIAVAESNGDPSAVGDNGDSIGAWQVQPRHWGPVSNSPVQQALQAERILEELEAPNARGSLCKRTLLARYNGGNRPPSVSYKYADRVVRLAGVLGGRFE